MGLLSRPQESNTFLLVLPFFQRRIAQQQIALGDPAADVDVPFGDVSGGAREDPRLVERKHGTRQRQNDRAVLALATATRTSGTKSSRRLLRLDRRRSLLPASVSAPGERPQHDNRDQKVQRAATAAARRSRSATFSPARRRAVP